MSLAISFAITIEDVRRLQGLFGHQTGSQSATGAGSARDGKIDFSESNGLGVAQTLLVAKRRYRAVVLKLRWPRSSWIVRRSAPDSSR
jgi:hypothetical protein